MSVNYEQGLAYDYSRRAIEQVSSLMFLGSAEVLTQFRSLSSSIKSGLDPINSSTMSHSSLGNYVVMVSISRKVALRGFIMSVVSIRRRRFSPGT